MKSKQTAKTGAFPQMASEQARIFELEERRAALADGSCLDTLCSKMPHLLGKEVRQAAERAGTTTSNWLMRAAIEKIVRDEMRQDARAMRPDGISQGLWNEIVDEQLDKLDRTK